jgi:hypothetical protein
MMTNMRVWGILFLVGAVAFLVAGFAVSGVLIAFLVTAIVFAMVGVLFLWLQTFMKDVPKVTMRSGLERMAAGTAFAAQQLQDMTGQGAGVARSGIDPRPGTATVVAVTDTGMLVNSDPVVMLDLSVTVDSRDAYAVRIRQIVGKLYVARLQPGATLPVVVDAQDPYQVTIQWTETSGVSPSGLAG